MDKGLTESQAIAVFSAGDIDALPVEMRGMARLPGVGADGKFSWDGGKLATKAEIGSAADYLKDQDIGGWTPQRMQQFTSKWGPRIAFGVMALKMAGMDPLEGQKVAGMMRDVALMFPGAGQIIAGAMTALPIVGMAVEKTLVPAAEKFLGGVFGAFNLGGSSAAGTTVDSTLIDPSEFNPAIIEEILMEVDQNPDFLGLGRPITREEIMNGEVAIPDAFLSEMASGHEMSLDEARGNAQKLAKGEGGIDATYTRHNLGTGGGTLDGQGVQTAVSIFKRFGHTAYHRRKQMMAHIKTVSDLQALQSDPKRWMQRKGFTDKDGNWTGG